jgi:hypothetical protein
MSEITLHTVKTPKSYSAKNDDFLGVSGVDNNYIFLKIYNIIFYTTYTIRHIFLCGSVEVCK